MKQIIFSGVILALFALTLSSCKEPQETNIYRNAVTDIDGNKYDAVKIGDQIWMRENLMTKHFSDGTPIPFVETFHGLLYQYYDRDSVACFLPAENNPPVNRMLYNGKVISESKVGKQICPEGWHLPSAEEWNELFEYTRNNDEWMENCGGSAAQALSSFTSDLLADKEYNVSHFSNAVLGYVTRSFIDCYIPPRPAISSYGATSAGTRYWTSNQLDPDSVETIYQHANIFVQDSFARAAVIDLDVTGTLKFETRPMGDGLAVRCVKD